MPSRRLDGYHGKWGSSGDGNSPGDFFEVDATSAESFERAVEFWFAMFEPGLDKSHKGAVPLVLACYGAARDELELLYALCDGMASGSLDDPRRAAVAVKRIVDCDYQRDFD